MTTIDVLFPLEAELAAALAALAPELEGARDQRRAGVDGDAEGIVNEEIAKRENLQSAILAMQNVCASARATWGVLLDAGYPALPVRQIPASEFAKFQANADTMAAFDAKLAPAPEATQVDVTAQAAEPK